MAIKKETKSKPRTTTVRKAKTVETKTNKVSTRTTIGELKKTVSQLEDQLKTSTEAYGKVLEELSNYRIKLDVMLGQMLKALFIIGIGPDELSRKCSQMFSRVESRN